MTPALLFATMTGLLTWKARAPRVAAVTAMLASATVPGWPHEAMLHVAQWLVNMSNYCAAKLGMQMNSTGSANGFPALIVAFIVGVDMKRSGGMAGRSTLIAGMLLPFLVPYFPGPIGAGATQALATASAQISSVVGGLI